MKSVVIAVLVAFTVLAVTQGHCPTRFDPPPCIAQNITWVERAVDEAFIHPTFADSPVSGFGEIQPFRDDLFDASGTILIGKVQGICTTVGASDFGNTTIYECTYTFYLGDSSTPSSSVNVAGQYRYSPDFVTVDIQSITGGTGRFTAAKGTVEVTTTPGPVPSYVNVLSFFTGTTEGCCS